MPIRIACPRCKEPLEVPDYASGRVIQCPACRALSEAPDVPPPRPAEPVRQPPREPELIERMIKSLYCHPLPNVSLFLGLLSLLCLMRPAHALVTGGVAICTGVFGRLKSDFNEFERLSGDAEPGQDQERVGIKKLDAGMTMGAIGIVLAFLLNWFGH